MKAIVRSWAWPWGRRVRACVRTDGAASRCGAWRPESSCRAGFRDPSASGSASSCAAPSSVGSSTGRRCDDPAIRSSRARSAAASASSTSGGICVLSSSFSALSSCGCSASNGTLVLREEPQRPPNRGGSRSRANTSAASARRSARRSPRSWPRYASSFGPGDITDGRQDRVLDDRPQQHAGAESRRPFRRFPRPARPAVTGWSLTMKPPLRPGWAAGHACRAGKARRRHCPPVCTCA